MIIEKDKLHDEKIIITKNLPMINGFFHIPLSLSYMINLSEKCIDDICMYIDYNLYPDLISDDKLSFTSFYNHDNESRVSFNTQNFDISYMYDMSMTLVYKFNELDVLYRNVNQHNCFIQNNDVHSDLIERDGIVIKINRWKR